MNQECLEGTKNNPKPFIILKNVRKEVKKKEQKRKQSYQHPTYQKKTRKMTIQVCNTKYMNDQNIPEKQEFHQFDIQEQYLYQGTAKIAEQIANMQEHHEEIEQIDEKQLENSIPFNCNEWELDKESPYLKTFSGMENEIEDLCIGRHKKI